MKGQMIIVAPGRPRQERDYQDATVPLEDLTEAVGGYLVRAKKSPRAPVGARGLQAAAAINPMITAAQNNRERTIA